MTKMTRAMEVMANVQMPWELLEDAYIADWGEFYKEHGILIPANKSSIRLPSRREQGFNRLLIIPEGGTANKGFDLCASMFPSWRSVNDLDEATCGRNDREPKYCYGVWVRDRVEADKELKSFSAKQVWERKISSITLAEREFYEAIIFYEKTGGHLDLANVTLCSGSRNADGYVPGAGWCDGEFGVIWGYPRYSSPCLRARVVVS